MSGGPPDNRGPVLFLVFLVMAALIAVAWGLGRDPQPRDGTPLGPPVRTADSWSAATAVPFRTGPLR